MDVGNADDAFCVCAIIGRDNPARCHRHHANQSHTFGGFPKFGHQPRLPVQARLSSRNRHILKTALAYNSDPVQITTTGTYAWMAKASKGQVESNPNVPVGEMSEMSISVNLSATASVSFEWSVDSEEEIGFLSFALDGNTVKSISGLVDFTRESFQILEGVHTLSWRYSKKAASNVGLDKGMVRSICVQNTTPGEWAYASTTGSSVTIESLNSGKDYIFRASSTERKNNSIKVDWSAPKVSRLLPLFRVI